MRIPTPIQALSAAAALALLAGCSSGSAIAPIGSALQGHHSVMNSGRIPAAVSPSTLLKVQQFGTHPNNKVGFNACPAAGTLIYMSDFNLGVVNIYKGGNTSPLVLCGQLTGLANPQGMIVKAGNLYVANTGGLDVLAFHRGATTPFITYTDPSCSGQFTVDVTVSSDNIVYASNIFGGSCEGSISAWNKNSGALIGNMQNPDGNETFFLTIQNNGTMYYDDPTGLFKQTCTAGSCNSNSNTGATFTFPGGVRSEDGEDLALDDQGNGSTTGPVTTFEPPAFGSGGVCNHAGTDDVSFDVNHSQHHMFLADAGLDQLTELKYTNTTGACAPKGSIAGNTSGLPIGVAVDRAENLQ
ncbi:MAG TPA: hypothetical protein VII69_09690 [Candidatus Eremiobacteraceae bacterium]